MSIHTNTISKFQERWPKFKSKDTCLMCLVRRPQYMLKCGHKVCENCLQVFGKSQKQDPWLFELGHCLLCYQTVRFCARIRPATAGNSVFCIDGGGVRGIIPIAILLKIQRFLDLPIPIQELFTLAYGTSVGMFILNYHFIKLTQGIGALLVLLLYIEGWSPERCASEYEELAKNIFPARRNSIFRWLVSIFTDGLYPSQGIERTFKQIHGEKKITGSSYATTIGAKIGVLTASVAPPSVFLFNNYNGIGNVRSGYRVADDCDMIQTWEV